MDSGTLQTTQKIVAMSAKNKNAISWRDECRSCRANGRIFQPRLHLPSSFLISEMLSSAEGSLAKTRRQVNLPGGVGPFFFPPWLRPAEPQHSQRPFRRRLTPSRPICAPAIWKVLSARAPRSLLRKVHSQRSGLIPSQFRSLYHIYFVRGMRNDENILVQGSV